MLLYYIMDDLVKVGLRALIKTLEEKKDIPRVEAPKPEPEPSAELSSQSGERKQLTDTDLHKNISECVFNIDKYEKQLAYYREEYAIRKSDKIPPDEKVTHEHSVGSDGCIPYGEGENCYGH